MWSKKIEENTYSDIIKILIHKGKVLIAITHKSVHIIHRKS